MIESSERTRVAAALPVLRLLEPEIGDEFIGRARLARFAEGQDVMAAGDRVEAVPVVVSGSIRVFKTGESGREITLYRFGPGECCVLSADSILGNRLFPARAQVVKEVEVALIPARMFNDWLARSPTWRNFVFGAMSQRLVSLMETLDEVTFARMDRRIVALLLERTGHRKGSFRMTHQQIADELGSSREVVSRILGDLQSQGLVRLTRGEIGVVDPAALSVAYRP